MCIENHHRWLYEYIAFMKSHYLLHWVLCLQRLVSRWPQEFGRQCYCLTIPRYIQWISFAFPPKCLDTVLRAVTQKPISSTSIIPPGHVTRHQRRWRDLHRAYSNICNKNNTKLPSNNLNCRQDVHFPFGSKNLSPGCDWHLYQQTVYAKTFKESVSSSSFLIRKQPQCLQRKFPCESTLSSWST